MNPSLECELTRVQMKRYLGGEELPEPLMEELEQHVHACASCRHYLDSQKLKLAAKLSGAKSDKVKAPVEPKGPKDSDVFHEPKQKLFTPKTLGLAAALALVLFAMSTIAKDPTILFGRKASTALAAAEKEKPEAEPTDENSDETTDDSDHDSHSKIGEIMTGESVKKELEDQKAKEAELAAKLDDSHETEKPPSEPSQPDSHTSPETSHQTAPAAKSEPKPEPKKQDMALIVAEHGTTKKEPLPKPRPEAKASAPRRSSPPAKKPSSSRRSTHNAAPKKSTPAKAGGTGSIRIYDSQGRPIN